MILAKTEILSEIKKGNIKINPFKEENVGACSVDLTLGNSFRRFKKNLKEINVIENINCGDFSEEIILNSNQTLTLKSGELILGITLEKITLANNLCAKLDGRSRFARIGLMVHVSSSLVQPGSSNMQVLEIINTSPFSLTIAPSLKICQIIFQRLSSKAEYNGRFKRQTKP